MLSACPLSPLVRMLGLVALASVVLSTTGDAREDAPARVVRHRVPTMGTVATVAVVTADSAESARRLRPHLAEFARIDSLMSNWTEDSEVARLNREAPHGPCSVHPEVLDVLRGALEVAEQSEGSFDPTIEPLVRLWGFLGGSPRLPEPERIEAVHRRIGWSGIRLDPARRTVTFEHPKLAVDLGAIAKGHAADVVADALRREGIEDALVDLSGNMVPLGHPPGRDSWVVGIRDPDSQAGWFASLRLEGDAVATSGNYEQFVAADGRTFGHVLDPRTGWPARGLDAVTVLAPRARLADAWATALLAAGPERARRLAAERDDVTAVLVHSAREGRREVWVERSLRGRLRRTESGSGRFEVRWF